MDKSIQRAEVFRFLFQKMNGFPHSRHRSKRIEKKLRRRFQPELVYFKPDTAYDLEEHLPIHLKHDATDALWFAYQPTEVTKS